MGVGRRSARGILGGLALAASAAALLATSEARWTVNATETERGTMLAPGATVRRRVWLEPSALALAATVDRRSSAELSVEVAGEQAGTPRPASLRVTVTPTGQAAAAAVATGTVGFASVHRVASRARAAPVAFDVELRWVDVPSGAAPAQVRWTFTGTFHVTGSSEAPAGASARLRVEALP